MAGLPFGDRAEQGGRVGIALHVGLLGEVQVTAIAWLSPANAAFRFSSVWLPFSAGMVVRTLSLLSVLLSGHCC